jgi:hypothetical protein
MNISDLKELLEKVRTGTVGTDEALKQLKDFPYSDLGYARIDNHREIRTGYPEIIFCAGKTIAQVTGIFKSMSETGTNIIATRATEEMYLSVKNILPGTIWYNEARIISLRTREQEYPETYISVVTAGTSDIPVAEEAAITAELLGNRVIRIYDAGVAGIHRLIDKLPEIRKSRVVIVIAGMEGALASVVGGLVDKPIIAVPTSIGYGANFGGVSALLTMLTSCSAGISVVNIDNGFGAGFAASRINHI